jgi:hypothetical protein
MSDPLDKSQQLPVPPKRTRGQEAMSRLEGRLLAIKRMQVRFTAQVMIGTAIWWAILYAWTADFQRTNFVFTNTFQYLAVAWACWFMYPYFMRVEAKQDVALAMGHDSVDLMAKMDAAIEQRAERFDKLMTRMETMMAQSEKGEGALANRFETMFRDEMEKLRAEIRNERGRTDSEIAAALEEGEASVEETGEAAAELPPPPDAVAEPCPFCQGVHVGPCMRLTSEMPGCSACGGDHDILDCPKRGASRGA